jgi:hypothetical protein
MASLRLAANPAIWAGAFLLLAGMGVAAAEKSAAPSKDAPSKNAPSKAASSKAASPSAKAVPAGAAEIRSAIARSLVHLEQEGLVWMREKHCMTCHQIPSMVWSFNEARRHGIAVDGARLAAWNQWAVDNGLKRARFFKVTDQSLSKLRDGGVPDAEVAKLAGLKDKNFVLEYEFRDALSAGEAKTVLAGHEKKLLEAAGEGGKGGSGAAGTNQYMATLIAGAAAGSPDRAASEKVLVDGLVKTQNQDGSWPPASQFKMQQRSEAEATTAVTLWTMWGLGDVPNLSPAGKEAVEKAREWLAKAPTETSTEVLMLRAMLARRDGDRTKSDELTARLLKLQHADGGWGWLQDREASDPFTTGMALYGLAYLKPAGFETALAKAREYLLSTQEKDGSWKLLQKVISAQKKADTKNGDAIYSYWATGWAVIGLSATLPE